MVKVAVIGAGVVGLSSALNIRRMVLDSHVTIIADQFHDLESHSNVGIAKPSMELLGGLSEMTIKKWLTESWHHFDGLLFSDEAGKAGVSMISGYHMWDTGKAFTRLPNLVQQFSYQYRPCTQKELAMFPGHRYRNGCFYTTHQVEGSSYLPWLREKFEEEGGVLLRRKVHRFEDLCEDYDIVVNCAGLKSGQLLQDSKLVVHRNQMLRVKAPWVKHFVFTDEDLWIVPCLNDVAIGSTPLPGDCSQEVRQKDSDVIWEKATTIMPSLKTAGGKLTNVSLRPFRKPIRVELEIVNFGDKKLSVVHNYGHGGNGVFVWGTSVHAAEIVRDLADNKMITK